MATQQSTEARLREDIAYHERKLAAGTDSPTTRASRLATLSFYRYSLREIEERRDRIGRDVD